MSVERLGLLQSVFAEYRAHTFFFLLLSSPYVHIHAAVDSMGDFSFSLTLESFVEANVLRKYSTQVGNELFERAYPHSLCTWTRTS